MTTIMVINKIQVAALVHDIDDYDTIFNDSGTAIGENVNFSSSLNSNIKTLHIHS